MRPIYKTTLCIFLLLLAFSLILMFFLAFSPYFSGKSSKLLRPNSPPARLQTYHQTEMERIMEINLKEGLDSKWNFTELSIPPISSTGRFLLTEFMGKQGRNLADHNVLSQPGIIPLDNQPDTTAEYYAYKYIFNNLKMYSTQFVVYPYSFTYSPNETADPSLDVVFDKGAVFSLKPDLLPNDTNRYDYFTSLRAASDIKFGKAKALYDINVAILKVEDYYEDIYKDLTYESTAYCNVLSSYLGKYSDCISGSDFFKFKNDTKNLGKTVLAYLSPEDIAGSDLLFTPDGAPRFQLFIIPDHYTGAHSLITSKLGSAGLNNMKAYLNKGGFIMASGKSGYLLETWDILPQGMYDTEQFVTSTNTNQVENVAGCDQVGADDFIKALLCMNVAKYEGFGRSFLLSTYMINPSKIQNMDLIMSYDSSSATLKKKDNEGFTLELSSEERQTLPFSLHTTYGKGQIYLFNGNPLFKGTYNTVFYNTLFLAMSKNVLIDAYIGSKDGKPIPGGEAGIQLNVKLDFMNLYDTSITDLALHVWLPNNVSVVEKPATCVYDSTDMSLVINTSALNESSHLKCSVDQVAGFEKYEVLLNIEILDHTVTQRKYDILMAAPAVVYTDTETMITHQYDMGGLRTDGALAALLRGILNPDPCLFVPFTGLGRYIDNVLEVENKEDTDALEPEYVGVVPLISPLLDANDQTKVVRLLSFLPSYYNTSERKYYYPFENEPDKNYDYVDYLWLNGRDVVMVDDWDTPAKKGKVLRNSSMFPEVDGTFNGFDIQNMNYSTTINSKHLVLKQIFYDKADSFFEHASQRELVFVDPTKEGGAKTLFPEGIPEEIKNPNKPNTVKKDFVWSRLDLYFYAAQEYLQPENINYTHVISVDRYPNYTGPCSEKLGDARAVKMVNGYFTIEKEDGLKPNEYSNELLMHCEKQKVWLKDAEKVSNGSIKPVHYLVPVSDPEVQRADDILDFVVNEDGTGHLEEYPELKFVYAHYFNITVPGNISRQGGRFEITFPEGVTFKNMEADDPIKSGYVTYSADQVAFYNTTYDPTARKLLCYFKRGLMPNEAYGKPSLIGFMIEELNTLEDVQATLTLYEMKYDLSAPEVNFQKYMHRLDKTITLRRDRFFSLPAVEVRVKVNRFNKTNILPYELLSPYTRFGVYIQELKRHRTVWWTVECHHVTDPGAQGTSPSFSIISNVGISSIPFVEYVTTGAAQLIPSAPSTSRLEWHDIWGRHWHQPLRSVFPDSPPLPGPLRNFMMTTTFELTKPNSKERVLEWNSDESLDIRVHLKLLNNYPKYFEITTCKENEVPVFQYKQHVTRRYYDSPPYSAQITSSDAPNSSYHISFATRSVYGMCFSEEGTVLKGLNVSSVDRQRIATAYLCADELDEERMLECINEYADLPTVTRRPSGDASNWWMYSPRVDRYYPKNYIKANMWDMTHEGYDDSPMCKAFNYHMDNNLPSPDPGPPSNPARFKPHNIISQPIFKGFGYVISYDKKKTLPRFPQYKGWWSDNLQNKDHTLVAGQSEVYDISVDKETLLPSSMWINVKDLINPVNENLAENRLKNIHVCYYNQHRIKLSVDQQRYAYLLNVHQNNIIPIIPELERDDPRLTEFDCSGVYQYSPYNISQVDNILETPTVRDWLYFSANLRGQALETINIPLTLNPYPGIKYEGYTKVQDGGRFVYWNPAAGPNLFLIVGNPVTVVEAKRSDLTIACEVIPKSTTTFNAALYHLLTVEDPAEKLREWKYTSYINHYGFGDASVSTYVGGAQGTKSMLNQGEYTLVKITFNNNAGFDWNMYGSAIDFEFLGNEAINADDLMNRKKHAIQAPTKYNFMILNIPDEIKDYIEIGPSRHNVDVAPQFFDFMDINVVTIRDGFIGEYYYRINVSDSIPDSIRGKVYEIGVELNETCFDRLPGYNDPTKKGYHDYKLKIPSIKFGIPYASGPYKGKAFYTSGYSTNLKISATVPAYWNFSEARIITEEQIGQLRQASGDTDTYVEFLKTFWEELDSPNPISVEETPSGNNKVITLNLSEAFPVFPLPNGSEPDITSFSLLMKGTATQVPYGTVRVISKPKIVYADFTNKVKSDVIAQPWDKTVVSKGAWLRVWYSCAIVEEVNGEFVETEDQRMFENDDEATVMVKVYTKNVGTDTAYNVNFTLNLAESVKILEEYLPDTNYTLTPMEDDTTVLKMDTRRSFPPQDMHSEVFYIRYKKNSNRRLLAGATSLTFIKGVSAAIDLLPTLGASQVSQSITTPLSFPIISQPRDLVKLYVETEFTGSSPAFHVRAVAIPSKTLTGKNVRYVIYRKILALDCEDNPGDTVNGKCSSIDRTEKVIKPLSEVNELTDKPISQSFNGWLRSGKYMYRVETYTESKQLMATSKWEGIAEKPIVPAAKKQTTSPEKKKIIEGETDVGPKGVDEEEILNNTNSTKNITKEVKAVSSVLPLWAIILIPIFALMVIIFAAMIVYRRYRLVKINPVSMTEVPAMSAKDDNITIKP